MVAAHRQNRPWTGGHGRRAGGRTPRVRSGVLPLSRATRASAARATRATTRTFVFDNDHPCVGPAAPREPATPPAPYRVAPAAGHARVVCFSPRHDLTLAEMSPAAIGGVVDVWRRETRDLGGRPGVEHVLCFENKGEVVGVSNPHPHGQIYATGFVWKAMEIELAASARHLAETGRGPDGRRDPRRAAGRRPARHSRGRARDRVRPLLRPLRVRGLRRPQAPRPARVRARRRRSRRAGARAVRGHDPLRQPVAHVVSVRDGRCTRRRPTAT